MASIPSLVGLLLILSITHCSHHKHHDNDTDTATMINLASHGPIEYCNVNPYDWDFEPLSMHDLQRIHKLHQVHILARHGTRIIPHSMQSVFPNAAPQQFHCNWTTVVTRFYNNDKDWMSFRMRFIEGEQVTEGNCAVSSSLQQVIPQHRSNAQMAKNFFVGEESYHLWTQSQLNDIAGQLTYYNQLRQSVDIPEMKIIAANYERTITSATVFMSEFLNINTPQVAMELFTHDFQSDPYGSNKDKNCPDLEKYISATGMQSEQYQQLMASKLYAQTQQDWKDSTGMDFSYDNGQSAVLMYCAGMNVPLSWDQFLNVLNVSYAIREALLSNEQSSPESCKLAASPMAWLFRELISNHILYLRQVQIMKAKGMNDEEIKAHFVTEEREGRAPEYYLRGERAQLIYHSVHDTSILFLLEALNISNGREPMFAEMLTLEIYERSNSDPWYVYNIDQVTDELFANYLFRVTRKGKPLAPFPGCHEEYRYTNSSLCSLSVLMRALDYGQEIKEWEHTCENVTDSYFHTHKKDGTLKKKYQDEKESTNGRHKNEFLAYLWTFMFGISVGVGVTVFTNKYHSWFNKGWKYETIL